MRPNLQISRRSVFFLLNEPAHTYQLRQPDIIAGQSCTFEFSAKKRRKSKSTCPIEPFIRLYQMVWNVYYITMDSLTTRLLLGYSSTDHEKFHIRIRSFSATKCFDEGSGLCSNFSRRELREKLSWIINKLESTLLAFAYIWSDSNVVHRVRLVPVSICRRVRHCMGNDEVTANK